MIIKKIKGTHDLLFSSLEKWKIVEDKLKELLEIYNFQEIRTPILEYDEVFYRSAEHSEMVLKETFKFQDKKGRTLVLRPEGTASVVRSYVENKLDSIKDILYKFYYYGPFFRYERPQKNRYRQFHQFGIEIINIKNVFQEVEVFFLLQEILSMFSLEKAKIQINTLGDIATRNNFLKIFTSYIYSNQESLCILCLQRIKRNILRIFDCKECQNKNFLKKSPVILDYLTIEANSKFKNIFRLLKKTNINFEINPRLVRGLDYYTDLVFEIVLPKNNDKNIVLGGGGNYNELIESFGGKKTNSMGFAFGIERLISVLEENSFFEYRINSNKIDIYLLNLDNQAILKSFFWLKDLRFHKIKSNMNYELSCFDTMLKKALQNNPRYIIFLGQKEIKSNRINIKNIDKKITYVVNEEELINFLRKELSNK
ncbi:histidine--tRNA ligase [Candidatus Phytoplasma pini]|uniref:Histidine--tRNA ligase n=1 Tax=Candidatus Phytoplasma pini TaxID=267362 RepID=A0A559KJC8_9MOLU|nr:histidine--tRNA ligase [Candidatus Phytoplasma pini]TVY12230.1 Histidyl-tRNA synthetase [Candidatus Phytoplasma pini]